MKTSVTTTVLLFAVIAFLFGLWPLGLIAVAIGALLFVKKLMNGEK